MNKDKYLKIEEKERKLSSGVKSNFYWNFRKLTKEDERKIIQELKHVINGGYDIIGIKTMGWEIVNQLDCDRSICYDPKNDTLSRMPLEDYIIFDDVITTGNSIRKCMQKVGRLPLQILCIKNRLNIREIGIEIENDFFHEIIKKEDL